MSAPETPGGGQPSKPAALKKNTVDYIPSKLSYDTAIPVSVLDDRTDFIERCKPYDIIDGPNPLDDVEDDSAAPSSRGTSGALNTATPTMPSAGHITAERNTGRRRAASAIPPEGHNESRKRSRSPLKTAGKGRAPASELRWRQTEVAASSATPSTAHVLSRPSRPGWAAEQLRDGRPYQLLRSHDMEARVRYVLDDVDYDWCQAHSIASESVQRGMTYLEWAYVSFLLTAATPQVEESALIGSSNSQVALNPSTGSSDDLEGSNGSTAVGSILVDNGSDSFVSSFALSQAAAARALLQHSTKFKRRGSGARDKSNQGSGNGDAHASLASADVCALCSKSVQLLSQQHPWNGSPEVSGGHRGVGAAAATTTSTVSGRGVRAGPGSSKGADRGRSTDGGAHGHASSSSLLFSTPYGAATTVGCFPSHDVQQQGLRCRECGVVAHLRCWFLTEPPRIPEFWICDGCTNYAQHRKRSAGVCCMCGRNGGVLLPYVSNASWKDDGDATDPRSPPSLAHSYASQGNYHGSSLITQSDMVCHAVCALTMPELAIHGEPTALRRNGLVDMEVRPYVYALRRVGKQKYAMHCVFCEHGGLGRCVQCHHPHCFEAMHASCAAEAHTVDCHAGASASPSSAYPGNSTGSGGSASTMAILHETPGNHLSRVNAVDGASWTSATPSAGTPYFTSCSPYCKKHHRTNMSTALGSAALGDEAEAEAMALDLTGLLTGGDGITAPVVRKRGRGRPPVALVQQREAERELIVQLRAYWRERRAQRRQSSAQLVSEINSRLRPVVEAMLRPEIVKVSADKVRLSHFLSLVPEWQWQLVSIVEGELPLPDEEYDDVQKYRKAAHTRRSGNTRSLYDKMVTASTQLDLMSRISELLRQESRLQRMSAELELQSLHILCDWKA